MWTPQIARPPYGHAFESYTVLLKLMHETRFFSFPLHIRHSCSLHVIDMGSFNIGKTVRIWSIWCVNTFEWFDSWHIVPKRHNLFTRAFRSSQFDICVYHNITSIARTQHRANTNLNQVSYYFFVIINCNYGRRLVWNCARSKFG